MAVKINGGGVQQGILVADHSISDLNDLLNGQIVLVTGDTSNAPAPGYAWGVCIALGYASVPNNGYRFQICFVTNGEIYIRKNVDNTGWSIWKRLLSE